MPFDFFKYDFTFDGALHYPFVFDFKGINALLGAHTVDVLLSGVSPLTLLNAIELNYIKAFGKCEQDSETYIDSVTLDGKCEQDGTPTPATPVDIVCNNGVIGWDSVNQQITVTGTVETATDNVGNVATAQPLLSVGDYKDTQEVLSGAVTRNVGVKALDGTEPWVLIDGFTNMYYTEGTDYPIEDNAVGDGVPACYCSHFNGELSTVNGANQAINTIKLGYSGVPATYHKPYIKSDAFNSNADNLKQFLSDQYANGTPVIVVYPLATATTETVSGQVLNKEPVTVTGSLTGLVANVVSSTHTTPKPTQPLDIVANNGVLKVTKNLIDLNTVTDGYYYDQQGVYTLLAAARLTDYIPIKAGQSVTVYFKSLSEFSNLNVRINLFNSSKVWQSQEVLQLLPLSGNTMIITPTYNGYIRVSGNYSGTAIVDWDTAKVVIGEYTVSTINSAIGSIYYDGTVETVSTGEGFDSADGQGTFVSPGSSVTTRIYKAFGQLPNGKYKVAITGNFEFIFQYKDTDVTIPTDYGNIDTWTTSGVYDLDKTGYYYGVAVRYPNNGTIRPSDFNGIISLIPLDNSATCQPLLSVGTYKDVQNITNGAITRNVGVKVLDGTEDWTYSNSRFRLRIADYLVGSSIMATIISHYKLPAINVGSIANGEVRFGKLASTDTVSSDNILIVHDDNYTDLNSYKAWLASQYAAGTPVIVVYPLATPTTETVTGQTLTITQGTNVVTAEGSVDDLELEISYKAYAEVTVEEIEAVNTDENVEVIIS